MSDTQDYVDVTYVTNPAKSEGTDPRFTIRMGGPVKVFDARARTVSEVTDPTAATKRGFKGLPIVVVDDEHGGTIRMEVPRNVYRVGGSPVESITYRLPVPTVTPATAPEASQAATSGAPLTGEAWEHTYRMLASLGDVETLTLHIVSGMGVDTRKAKAAAKAAIARAAQ